MQYYRIAVKVENVITIRIVQLNMDASLLKITTFVRVWGEIMLYQSYIFLHTIPDKVFCDFTSDDKIYLTYPYPTRGIDKKTNNNTCQWRSRNYVVKTLGVDVIGMSHTTWTFNMADVNV